MTEALEDTEAKDVRTRLVSLYMEGMNAESLIEESRRPCPMGFAEHHYRDLISLKTYSKHEPALMCNGVHHAREYTLGTPLRGAGPYRLMESKATACNPGTAERYINPITRHLKAVPRYAEADWQVFCQSSKS